MNEPCAALAKKLKKRANIFSGKMMPLITPLPGFYIPSDHSGFGNRNRDFVERKSRMTCV